jgi:hypothetical protein
VKPEPGALGAALSRALDRAVVVRPVEPIGAWAVARVRLEPETQGEPSTAIVKWLRQDGQSKFRNDPARLTTEWDARREVGGLGLELASRPHGYDAEFGLLVIEDLALRRYCLSCSENGT